MNSKMKREKEFGCEKETESRIKQILLPLVSFCSCLVPKKTRKRRHQSTTTPSFAHFSTKKTLVLDLDETLVHSSYRSISNPDLEFFVPIHNKEHKVHVRKRPFLEEFLASVKEKFEVVIFTASVSSYSCPLIDLIDTEQVVQRRLYRESCITTKKGYVKDLSKIGRNIEDIIIIDNCPISYCMQPYNAIPIKTWTEDPQDCELLNLIPVLDLLSAVPSVPELFMKIKTLKLGLSTSNIEWVLGNYF